MESNENNPFFSVIICTFNRAAIIERALKSLLAQENQDWEGLIIDDGSNDHTQQVIAPYIRKYPLRYIKKKHNGCAGSKNAGMKAATGRYLTFLDTDDEYLPEHLRIRYDLLKRNPQVDLLHSNVKIIGNPYLPDKNNPQKEIHINDCVVGGTFFIKREHLTREDHFEDRYSDDSLFLERMIAEGRKILKIDAPTYVYHRDSEDSLCTLEGRSL